jgi:hypothetical protein
MPVLARFLARLIAVWLYGAARRRAGTAGRPAPPWRTPGTASPPGTSPETMAALRARGRVMARRILEVTIIAGHAITLAAFLAAFGVLAAAGTTATSLGPQWLGIALLVLSGIALIVALRELRIVWRLRVAQHRRRKAEQLRHLEA